VFFSPTKVQKPIVGGIFAAIVPLGMFLIPSVNPSSWAVISASIIWASLVGFFYSESRLKRNALLTISIVATVLGSGARTDSAIYAILAFIVSTLLCWKLIRTNPILLLKSSFVLPIALFFFFTSGSSSIAQPISRAEGFDLRLAVSNLLELPSLWAGALGGWGLGWLDTRMPSIVFLTSVFVFSGIIFFGLVQKEKNKFISITLLFLALTLIPLYVLVNEGISVGAGVQPRYLYPLMIMIAGVSLWGIRFDESNATNSRNLVLFSGFVLSIANSVALHVNLRRYVTGIDVGGYNLNRDVEWWWSAAPSPMAIWTVGSLAFLITALLIANLARQEKVSRPANLTPRNVS
jgi:hypothetical protein